MALIRSRVQYAQIVSYSKSGEVSAMYYFSYSLMLVMATLGSRRNYGINIREGGGGGMGGGWAGWLQTPGQMSAAPPSEEIARFLPLQKYKITYTWDELMISYKKLFSFAPLAERIVD